MKLICSVGNSEALKNAQKKRGEEHHLRSDEQRHAITQANLDHAPMFAGYFDDVDDPISANLMRQIAEDEITHVGFGAKVLRDHAAGEDTFTLWSQNLTFHNTPERARGPQFNEELRRRAGLDEAFIRQMREL